MKSPKEVSSVLKAFVEALGHLLDVQRLADFGSNCRDIDPSFFSQVEDNLTQALEEGITALSRVKLLLAAGGGLAGLPLDPLPYLRGLLLVGEDDQVLEGALGDLALYLAPDGVRRNRSVLVRCALEDGESRLLRDGFQGVFPAVHEDGQRLGLVVVPAQAVHEKAGEVEVPQMGPELFNRDRHQELSSLLNSPREQMICGS